MKAPTIRAERGPAAQHGSRFLDDNRDNAVYRPQTFMPNISTRQSIGAMFWALFGRARHYSTFLLGLSAGVLLGFLLSAPILGWHLSQDASSVLSAFFGGTAGVFGAVLIWRLQDQAQKSAIVNMVVVSLINLRAATDTTQYAFDHVDQPKEKFEVIDSMLRPDLLSYLDLWNGLGVHQSVFNAFATYELTGLKKQLINLEVELKKWDARVQLDRPTSAQDAQDATWLLNTIALCVNSTIGRVGVN